MDYEIKERRTIIYKFSETFFSPTMSLYPSLEDMVVDQMVQAQQPPVPAPQPSPVPPYPALAPGSPAYPR